MPDNTKKQCSDKIEKTDRLVQINNKTSVLTSMSVFINKCIQKIR